MVCSCFPSRTNITKNEQKRALAPIFTSVWNKTPLWKTRRLTYTANHFKNFHCFEVSNNHAPAFHQGSILLKWAKKGVGGHIYFCMKWNAPKENKKATYTVNYFKNFHWEIVWKFLIIMVCRYWKYVRHI